MGDVIGAGSQDSAIDAIGGFVRHEIGTWWSAAFQIGDGHFVLRSSDYPLLDRFRRLYGDCEVDEHAARGPRVECVVWTTTPATEVEVDVRGSGPVALDEFMAAAFADRGCQRVGVADGWHLMESRQPAVSFRVGGHRVVFPVDSDWRGLAANLAVGLVVRLQVDTIFLHAAGVGLGAARRGVLLVGPKGAGKTTTALGLASRGHAFLGDEIVGVRHDTLRLVPVLRTISKRDGPCVTTVHDAIAVADHLRTRYPDGESRTIVAASQLFALGGVPVALGAIVFLDGFAAVPAMTPLRPSLAAASRLTPVTSTLWGRSLASRAFALLKLLSAVPGFLLTLGPPDVTSRLLEEGLAH